MKINSLTDTHFHFEDDDNIDSILKRAIENGVENYIISACDISSINKYLKIAAKYPNMYLTIGIHPDEIKDYTKNNILYLEQLALNNKKIIGIGEIGLDYYHNKENKEEQKHLFIDQLKIAEKLNLPVVIHSREAFQDTYDILKEYKLKTTIHCFSGSLEVANLYIQRGYLLGIGGVSTFKNTNLKEVIKSIPLANIVLETDSPYLTPFPYRGERNEPKNISLIGDNLCLIKNITKSELIKVTNNNIIKQYQRITDIY